MVGSSQGEELSGGKMPKGFFKSISNIQIKEGMKQIERLDDLNLLRKKNAQEYTNFLKKHHKVFVLEDFFNNHSFF